MKTFITLGVLILSLLATIPAVLAQEKAVQTVVFNVEGMVSQQCPKLLEASTRNIAGIVSVSASYSAKQAAIEYDPAAVTPHQIGEWIEQQTGFTLVERGAIPIGDGQ